VPADDEETVEGVTVEKSDDELEVTSEDEGAVEEDSGPKMKTIT